MTVIFFSSHHTYLFQVPGRLGLLVTLDLIVTNVYNSVKAPAQRGFSYIEIWMIGVQIPILVGILEYATLLALKKYYNGKEKSAPIMVSQSAHPPIPSKDNLLMEKITNETKSDWAIIEKNMDKWTFMVTLAFILTFNMIYWVLALM